MMSQWNATRMMSALIGSAVLACFATNASAVDYADAIITGVGISPGDNGLRFTIDKDPYVILRTTDYAGEDLQRVTALILAAYTSQLPVKFVRSQESSSTTTLHYSDLAFISLGARTWD
jgi:hypothetical protein